MRLCAQHTGRYITFSAEVVVTHVIVLNITTLIIQYISFINLAYDVMMTILLNNNNNNNTIVTTS